MNTHTFQAPDFYRALGYDEVDDGRSRTAKFSLRKDCKNQIVSVSPSAYRRGMFDVLDELESAIDKVVASERDVDVERMVRLSERVEYLKLRTIREYELSGAWQAEGFVSTGSALRNKCRMSHAQSSVVLARKLEVLPETARPG